MKTLQKYSLAVLAAATVVFSGCTPTRTWDPNNKPISNVGESGLSKRIVVIAPVDGSTLAAEYPEGPIEFARSLARRADIINSNLEAWVGETLPNGSSPEWNKGPLGAAAGAHNIVLGRVVKIENKKTIVGRPNRIIATVAVHVINANGEQEWANEFKGYANDVEQDGPDTPGGQPVAVATFDAFNTASWGLKNFFDSRGAPGATNPSFVAPVVEEPALIDVTVSSIPENADIFVDGIFRGTTPVPLPLPVTEQTIRIERAGYTPWERTVKPSPGMKIQPALLPINAVPQDALPLPDEEVKPAIDSNSAAVSAPEVKAPAPAPVAEVEKTEAVVEAPAKEVIEEPAPIEELEGVDLPPVE